MTLAAQAPFVRYNGNGSTTVFSITFEFFSNNNFIQVILRDENVDPPTETTLSYSTHYTISGTNLTMLTAPASGEKLWIGRNMTYEQLKDFISSGSFLVEECENGLDRLDAMIQQVGAQVDRALKFTKSSAATNATMESFADNAGKLLAINDDEDGIEYGPTLDDFNADVAATAAAASAAASSASAASSSASSASTSASNAAASALAAAASAASAGGTEAQETPTGSGTAFSVANTPNSSARFKLYRNGLFLTQGTDYTLSGSNITLTDSLDASQSLVANYFY